MVPRPTGAAFGMSMEKRARHLRMAENCMKGKSESDSSWRVIAQLATVSLLSLLVLFVCFNSELAGNLQQRFRDYNYMAMKPPDWTQESHVDIEASKVGALLDKLRELIRLTSDGADYSLTDEERQAWITQNPCQSRSEMAPMYALRKNVRKLPINPLWDQILDEYSTLHRICTKRVGSNIRHYFLNKSSVSIPGCKFLVGEGTFGLGNKVLVTVSTVLYAILTQRVLLVPTRTNLNDLLCEPFVGSSWTLDDRTFPMPGNGPANNTWDDGSVFIQGMDARLLELKEEDRSDERICTSSEPHFCGPPLVNALIVSASFQNWEPREWFYCETEEAFMSAVPWVYMSGCIYTVPKIFGSPAFRSTLKALFPDNMVLTRLLRSTILPSDAVWIRFKHLNHAYFQHADRRVAIQLRFFGNHDDMFSVMNYRVLNCVLTNGILPNVSESMAAVDKRSSTGSAPPSITSVFIASLYVELRELLSEFYLRSPTVTGEDVELVQLTSNGHQSEDLEEDIQAMVEVLLLSVADALLVTPKSTFGGLAQGYGGLTPWFIRSSPLRPEDTNMPSSCERAQTVDTCQQGGSVNYHCPNDPSSRAGRQKPPPASIGNCLSIDVGGVQVLDNNYQV